MKRELKFRVWNGEQFVSPDRINRDGTAFWFENSIPEVSREIEQFTGVQDTKGNEIAEGDTCTKSITENVGKHTKERTVTGEVVWSKIKAGFVLMVKDYSSVDVLDLKHFDLSGCTIIGNIHQQSSRCPTKDEGEE